MLGDLPIALSSHDAQRNAAFEVYDADLLELFFDELFQLGEHVAVIGLET